MAEHNELGKIGEEIALRFLKEKGYDILYRNWKYRKYEIDIIAVKNDILVFVEVKTRTPSPISSPEDSLTRNKQKQLVEGAHHYITLNHWQNEARIDVITIMFINHKPKITHIENAIIPRW